MKGKLISSLTFVFIFFSISNFVLAEENTSQVSDYIIITAPFEGTNVEFRTLDYIEISFINKGSETFGIESVEISDCGITILNKSLYEISKDSTFDIGVKCKNAFIPAQTIKKDIIINYYKVGGSIQLKATGVISGKAPNITEYVSCADSDNGLDYYTFGEGKGEYVGGYAAIYGKEPDVTNPKETDTEYSIFYDHCANDKQLNEAYCNENGKLSSMGYICENGCVKGACISNIKESIFLAAPFNALNLKIYSNSISFTIKNNGNDNVDIYDIDVGGCSKYTAKTSLPSQANLYFTCATTQTYSLGQGIQSGIIITYRNEGGNIDQYASGELNGKVSSELNTTTQNPPREKIKELVKCLFKGSTSGNECYASGGPVDEINYGITWCKGIESCTVNIPREKGDNVEWKSSCGGYQYTIQDGIDETIYFECATGETNTSVIAESWYRKAYWLCGNGNEYYEGGESSCKPYELWKKYAYEYCSDDLKDISVSLPCYPSDSTEVIQNSTSTSTTDSSCNNLAYECKKGTEESCKKWSIFCDVKETNATQTPIGIICKDSCPLEGKCYPFGYRVPNKFCSDSGAFVEQTKDNKSCDNNFECKSNVCINNECISQGLIKKILAWFKNLFS